MAMLTRRELIVMLGAVAVAVPAFAADETFKGELVCAKCGLKKADAKDCQDVLLVKNGNTTTEYYITKNKVWQEAGEACTDVIPATITGVTSEQDGRKWLTASKIVKEKK